MYRIITPDQFIRSPWKNGGGITDEIARDVADDWAWRISIATVASDGPFSIFAGKARILTVIDGAGIDLTLPDQMLPARLGMPVHFSGDTPITSRMIAGPIRDFNLIYDPARVQADVQLIDGPLVVAGADMTAVLCLTGRVVVAGADLPTELPLGAVAFGQGNITLGAGAQALIAVIDRLSNPEPPAANPQ